MAMKYFRYSVKAEEMHHAVAEGSAHGLIVRTHTEGGQAHVYVASDRAAENPKIKPSEVSESDVTKIG
jgi:hypothetical protein